MSEVTNKTEAYRKKQSKTFFNYVLLKVLYIDIASQFSLKLEILWQL